MWVTFAVVFEAWGLLPLTVALIFIYSKALVDWRRDDLASAVAAALTSVRRDD